MTKWVKLEDVRGMIAEQNAVFGSDEYATPQPIGSFQERFACTEIMKGLNMIPAISAPEGLANRLDNGFVSEESLDEAAAFLRTMAG